MIIKAGRFNIFAPLSHNLPLYKRLYPQYDENLPRIAGYIHSKYKDLKLIDIGANVGDTAAIVKSYADIPILCIEGEETFFGYLQKNIKNLKNVEAVKAFVGKNDKKVPGKLVTKGGTASFDTKKYSNTVSVSLKNILNTKINFSGSKLLKIDTDGYDTIIIENSLNFIKRHFR